MRIEIPGYERWELKYLVLDFNGTLATGGILLSSVVEPLRSLAQHLEIHVVTSDTYGTVAAQMRSVHARYQLVEAATGRHKLAHVAAIGAERVVAIGNGCNDALMLRSARLGIAVIGAEGAAGAALQAADVVCNDIGDALGLLLDVRRLVAVLRL